MDSKHVPQSEKDLREDIGDHVGSPHLLNRDGFILDFLVDPLVASVDVARRGLEISVFGDEQRSSVVFVDDERLFNGYPC